MLKYDFALAKYGEYKGLKFHSLMKSKSNHYFRDKIYRFKGVFSSGKDIEIRTTIDDNGEFSEFYLLPWKDKMFKFN